MTKARQEAEAKMPKGNRRCCVKHLHLSFNRLDDIIIFNPLEKKDIHKIIEIELQFVYQRLNELDIELSLSNKAKDAIAEKGWSSQFGARPLKRTIQKYVEDLISEEIINESIKGGDKITLDYNNDKDIFLIKKKKNTKTNNK